MSANTATIERKIQFNPSPGLPYLGGDHVQISVLNDDVALTFYQVDYQAVADSAGSGASSDGGSLVAPAYVVAKIVMKAEAFQRFCNVGIRLLTEAGK